MSMMPTVVRAGSPAPDFSLRNTRGEARSLCAYLAAGPLLLAFHRGTW
jgi:peroxiredoxin